MDFRDNLKYTKDHEWIRVDNDKQAYVGITDFAQSELGDIVYVEIETAGEELDQEAVFGTIEAVKTVSDLYMPVAGKVLEVNPQLEDNPELVNKDPYGEGWLIKIEVSDTVEMDSLLDVDAYRSTVSA